MAAIYIKFTYAELQKCCVLNTEPPDRGASEVTPEENSTQDWFSGLNNREMHFRTTGIANHRLLDYGSLDTATFSTFSHHQKAD